MSMWVADLSTESDEGLMHAYVAGDAAAHHELFMRLAPPLLGLARRHLRDEAEAEDVVQRAFLQIHRARYEFREDAKLRPWVVTIAMNIVRDELRRRSRRRESTFDPEDRRFGSIDVDALERDEDARLVHRALAILPADQRRAIELHWIEERPFGEIARMVGASVAAVKVRAHRGYQRMRRWLETERGD
jgi:RNA polymerase sigma-70 factor (ECF subfamily)